MSTNKVYKLNKYNTNTKHDYFKLNMEDINKILQVNTNYTILYFILFQSSPTSSPSQSSSKSKEPTADTSKDGLAYSCLLKNELLSAGIEDLKVKYTGFLFLLVG